MQLSLGYLASSTTRPYTPADHTSLRAPQYPRPVSTPLWENARAVSLLEQERIAGALISQERTRPRLPILASTS